MQRYAMRLSCFAVLLVFLSLGCSDSETTIAGPDATGAAVSSASSDPFVQEAPNAVTKPFRGRYSTTFTPPQTPPPFLEFDIWGDGVATLIGRSTWHGPSLVDLTQVPPVQTGSAVFTAANGDHFTMTYAGGTGPGPTPADVVFSGEFWISNGTGRFEGATGNGLYEGTASNATGTGEISYDGTITTAKNKGPK